MTHEREDILGKNDSNVVWLFFFLNNSRIGQRTLRMRAAPQAGSILQALLDPIS